MKKKNDLKQYEKVVAGLPNWKVGKTLEVTFGCLPWYWETWTMERVSENQINYKVYIGSQSGYYPDETFTGQASIDELLEFSKNRLYSDKSLLEVDFTQLFANLLHYLTNGSRT